MKLFQKGFNYSQDGPGNRLVYHLKGCNMRCPWCSNPEGMHPSVGEYLTMSPQELIAEAVSAKPMFFDGGGVTFTGGEATLQAKELEQVLEGLKEHGIHTAIETNGTYRQLSDLFLLLDYLIVDLKHPCGAKHRRITGVDNVVVKENIQKAAESGKDLLIRIPLIGGFNNDDESLQGFLEFFKGLDHGHAAVEILKYHEYGKDKWAKCGMDYQMTDAFVSEDNRRRFETEIQKLGLPIIRT